VEEVKDQEMEQIDTSSK
jgi:hypothetical protein